MPTITFFDLDSFSGPFFRQEGVTITGSGNVVGGSTPIAGGRSGTDLGINDGAINSGEFIEFSFDVGAASGVSYSVASASGTDGDSLFGEGNLEAFDVNGNSLGILPSDISNRNISSLFGNQLISRFRLTQSESLSIGNLTFTSVPVLAAVNDALTTTEDDPITFNVRDNDTFLLSGSPTFSFDSSALQGSLTHNGNGNFTYNPGTAFQALSTGQTATTSFQYTLVYDLTAGFRSSTATVTFTITGLNDNQPPTAVNFSNTTTALDENTSTANRIRVADIAVTDDGLGTNNLSLTNTDAAAFELDGSVLYLKAGSVLDYETKTSYSVTVNVDDPTLGTSPDASRAFILSVTDVNEAPTATDETVSTRANTAVTVDLSDNGSDPDSNGLTGATLNVTSSTGGTTRIDPNTRQATFTPTPDFAGTAAFQYTLTDAGGLVSNVATVTVAVLPVEGELGTALPPIEFNGGQTGLRRRGTNRNDTLRGSFRNDILIGLGGNDRLLSGSRNFSFGRDRLSGGAGNDLLVSGAGNDLLDGGSGNDRLKAESGNDLLLGDDGNDTLQGDAGNDVITGGAGTDTSRGGAGRDTFVFNAVIEGSDLIQDFEGAADLIDLRSIFAQAAFSGATPFARFRQFIRLEQVGSNTAITIDADGNGVGSSFTTLATLSNVSLSAVSSKNFVIR